MTRFACYLLVLAVLLFATEMEALDYEVGSCECGAFRMAPRYPEPILHRRLPLVVSCDAKGAELCRRFCVSLAEATESNGAELLCASLMDVDRLTVGIETKSCDQDQWVFTGLSSESICCVDGKSVACQ